MTNLNEINKKISKLKEGAIKTIDVGLAKSLTEMPRRNYTTEKKEKTMAEKKQEVNLGKKAIDICGEGKQGGARVNGGRKANEVDPGRKSFKAMCEEFGYGEVEVSQLDKGTKEVRIVKMQRVKVLLERLFKDGQGGNTMATNLLLERIAGKVPNKLVGDVDEAPILTQQVDINKTLEKTYGQE